MRRAPFAVPLALLAACAVAGPMPQLPASDELAGRRVFVLGPLSVGMGGPDMPGAGEALARAVAGDLGAAGAQVVFSADEAELGVRLDSFQRSTVDATVFASSGAVVDQVRASDPPCLSIAWGLQFQENARCLARALVAQLLQSPRVAQSLRGAARASPAPAPAAPSSSRAAAPARAPSPAPEPARRRTPLALKGKLAVLELKSHAKEINVQQTRYFTDVVRQATLKVQPQLDVMTRENLVVLLQATGKKLEECEGECEVDTGRRIGADLIVSGEIQKVGTRFKLSLKLHDTKEGRLLSTSIGSGKSVDELDDGALKASEDLLSRE